MWAGYSNRYSDWLRAGQSGDRIPVGARLSTPVQTGRRAHPTSCTMGTGSFPGVKSGRGVTLTTHPLLVPWSWKGKAISLLPLRAARPVQSLGACTGVTFTFFTFNVSRNGMFYSFCNSCHQYALQCFYTFACFVRITINLPTTNRFSDNGSALVIFWNSQCF